VPSVVRDLPEALGPVVAAAGEDLDRLVGEVDLDAVAVELGFVNPALSGRRALNHALGGQYLRMRIAVVDLIEILSFKDSVEQEP
jgi:hypothetical protein